MSEWVVTLAQANEPVEYRVKAETVEKAIEEIWRQFGISAHIMSIEPG